MLSWAALLLLFAILAGTLGFGSVVGVAWLAKLLFFIFVVLFLIVLLAGLTRHGMPRH